MYAGVPLIFIKIVWPPSEIFAGGKQENFLRNFILIRLKPLLLITLELWVSILKHIWRLKQTLQLLFSRSAFPSLNFCFKNFR